MGNVKWVGGASASAQVTDLTPANVEVNDIFTATFTAEDGSTTVDISFTATAATVANVTAGLTSAINSSSNSLVDGVVTATDATTKVTVTADTPGIPFYLTASATDGGGTDTQTLTPNTTTSNSGPHDWNTTANWEGAALPVDTDDVRLTGAHDIRYGLDQSAIQLTSLYVGQDYTGSVGDVANSYYLIIDAATLNVSGSGAYYFINGDLDSVYVKSTRSGNDRVWLDGDVDNLWVIGNAVQGEVKCAASMILDNVYVSGAPRSRVTLGASITSFDLVEMDSGSMDNSSSVASVKVSGGEYIQTDGAVSSVMEVRSNGVVKYNTDGTLADLDVFNGRFTLEDSTADSVTITNAELVAGEIVLNSGMNNVTFSNDIVNRGGKVTPEAGKSVTP